MQLSDKLRDSVVWVAAPGVGMYRQHLHWNSKQEWSGAEQDRAVQSDVRRSRRFSGGHSAVSERRGEGEGGEREGGKVGGSVVRLQGRLACEVYLRLQMGCSKLHHPNPAPSEKPSSERENNIPNVQAQAPHDKE
jgi:hypothetical protein